MKHHQIIIVGGGNAGLSIASQLLIKNKKIGHWYHRAIRKNIIINLLFTLVGGGAFNAIDTVRDEKDFIPLGTKWIKDAVENIDPNKKSINLYKW